MEKQNIIEKLKERYDWRGYLISSIIVSILAYILHLKDLQTFNLEIFLLTLLCVWMMVFIFMVVISEFLK